MNGLRILSTFPRKPCDPRNASTLQNISVCPVCCVLKSCRGDIMSLGLPVCRSLSLCLSVSLSLSLSLSCAPKWVLRYRNLVLRSTDAIRYVPLKVPSSVPNPTANSAGGERLHWEGETSCSRGETGDIILLNESLRFIQNVASCYALCLTKESVNTATLVHAPACVCHAQRSEWYKAWNTKSRRVRI